MTTTKTHILSDETGQEIVTQLEAIAEGGGGQLTKAAVVAALGFEPMTPEAVAAAIEAAQPTVNVVSLDTPVAPEWFATTSTAYDRLDSVADTSACSYVVKLATNAPSFNFNMETRNVEEATLTACSSIEVMAGYTSSLKVLSLGYDGVAALSGSFGNADLAVYVPDARVEAYGQDASWSSYDIRPASELDDPFGPPALYLSKAGASSDGYWYHVGLRCGDADTMMPSYSNVFSSPSVGEVLGYSGPLVGDSATAYVNKNTFGSIGSYPSCGVLLLPNAAAWLSTTAQLPGGVSELYLGQLAWAESRVIENSTMLETLVLGAPDVLDPSALAMSAPAQLRTVYVPDELVDAYESMWSTWTGVTFTPLSQYAI